MNMIKYSSNNNAKQKLKTKEKLVGENKGYAMSCQYIQRECN